MKHNVLLDDSVFHPPKCQCWLNTSRLSGRQNRKGPLKMTQTILVFSCVRKILPVSLFLAQASLVGRHCRLSVRRAILPSVEDPATYIRTRAFASWPTPEPPLRHSFACFLFGPHAFCLRCSRREKEQEKGAACNKWWRLHKNFLRALL